MDDHLLLQELESLAERLSVHVRYDRMDGLGGLCRYRGELYLIINRALPTPERIRLFVRELSKFPLDDIYLRPQVRELLEQQHVDR